MKVKNLKVHDLYESIIRSGYPMLTGEPPDNLEKQALDLKWWFEEGGLLNLDKIFTTKDFIPYSRLEEESAWCQMLSKKVLVSNLKMSLEEALNHYRRVKKLSSCKPSSGHNNYEKGILVSFDLEFSHTILPQTQRYHWFEIVSSQSKMHRMLKNEFKCTSTTLKGTKQNLDRLIEAYKTFDKLVEEKSNAISINSDGEIFININKFDGTVVTEPFDGSFVYTLTKKELFKTIVDNAPMGLKMWEAITTNYLQLKNMYRQRHTHKMSEWVEFCKIIKELPLFDSLILQEKHL